MARPGASALSGIGKLTELRQRVLFLLGAMVVYRIGTHIPVPGVDPAAVAALFEQTRGSIVDIFNMFSGGALSRLSIFALGVMPYISASIIMQMMSAVIPQLEQLKKEGEAGRRKITQYTRYGTLVLAAFQGLGIAVAIEGQVAGGTACPAKARSGHPLPPGSEHSHVPDRQSHQPEVPPRCR